MATVKTNWVCTECSNRTKQWYGKCPKCGTFSSMEEVADETASNTAARAGLKSSNAIKPSRRAQKISDLSNSPVSRTPTGIAELDRVLGGGFVDAEVVLFAGQPGAGKSTLSLSIADKFAEMGKRVLYSSGEESEHQIGLRAQRMGITNELITVINETSLESLLGHIEIEQPDFLIVDSLQTIASSEVPGSIGSISQSREAAHALSRLAKSSGITMLLINQVVKES